MKTKILIPENDNKIQKTVYKQNNRIKTKHIYKINKCNDQLSYKKPSDQIEKKSTACFMQKKKKSLKIKGLKNLTMTMKNEEIASKYRMRKQKSQYYQKITLRQ